MNRSLLLPGLAVVTAMVFQASAASITLISFESGTPEGWGVNSQSWAGGFSSMGVTNKNATQGTNSLAITFTGDSFRWGGILTGLGNTNALNAIKYGGKIQFDLFVPASATGLQNLGFSFQQPDVTGNANWQQVWFSVAGQSGSYVVELPFTRNGTAPVTLNLGQNATPGSSVTVFVDNFRVIPNSPPAGITLSRTIPFFSFEDGTVQGFEANNQSWGQPFKSIEVASTNATAGTNSLKLVIPAASFAWGAWRLGVSDSALLSEMGSGGKFLLDLYVPPTETNLTHLGFVMKEPDVSGDTNWHQTWYYIGGATGKFTVDVPFQRYGTGPIEFHLGRNASGPDTTVFIDNLRLVVEEVVAGVNPTIAISRSTTPNARIEFSGALEASSQPGSGYVEVTGATTPYTVTPSSKSFYRARGSTGLVFSDDFEGANKGWTTKAISGNSGTNVWARGTPRFEPDLSTAHSGTNVWSASLGGYYGPNAIVALVSPVIDLTQASNARLIFYDVVDTGADNDMDSVAVYARDASGAVITGAEAPVYVKTKFATSYGYQREKVELPAVVARKQIKLEFRFTSNSNPGDAPQLGWFIDDVQVYMTP